MEKVGPQTIYFYRKNEPYGEFSNFYPSIIELGGKKYPTVQHYFQSQKFVGKQHEIDIINAPGPYEAFKMGQSRHTPIREDWQTSKDDVMYAGLQAKFKTHDNLKQKLLSTGDKRIVQHTTNDKYWADGGGQGKGLNKLGSMLMKLRSEIVQEIKKQ